MLNRSKDREESRHRGGQAGYGRHGLIRLKDGDVLNFTFISPRFVNSVTLRGNVATSSGRYPWHEGMRISDLIPDRVFPHHPRLTGTSRMLSTFRNGTSNGRVNGEL